MDLENKVKGAIYGHLIGDAFGVPYEFKKSHNIPVWFPKYLHEISMTPPPGYNRAWKEIPPGTWSDDGSQMLCLYECINHGYDQKTFVNVLLNWRFRNHLWIDGKNFDCGLQTARTLDELSWGASVEDLQFDEKDNGNGSLMRCLPVGLFFKGDDIRTISDSQSSVTHGHPLSKICCHLYCCIIEQLLKDVDFNEAVLCAIRSVRDCYDGTDDERWFNQVIDYVPWVDGEYQGSGYVVDSLWSAVWAVRGANSYAETITRAVMLGNDTDTTACIAGGMAGVIYGFDRLPSSLLNELRGKEIVESIMMCGMYDHC